MKMLSDPLLGGRLLK